MASYQVLYWYDIPMQVKATEGRTRHSTPLPDRFQEAVDAAAMAAGLAASDAYMDQFHWTDAEERAGTPAEISTAVAAELDAQYPDIDWRASASRLREERGEAPLG